MTDAARKVIDDASEVTDGWIRRAFKDSAIFPEKDREIRFIPKDLIIFPAMTSVPRLGDIPRRLTVDEFWNLFGRLEHEQLDFKRGVPDDVRDTIAAMAMTHGGLIVHGVDDRRNIVGCPLSQNTQIGSRASRSSAASTSRSER